MHFDLTVISWNLQHSSDRSSARIALLEELEARLGGWDVLCAQEATPAMREELTEAFNGPVAYFFDQPSEMEDGARSASMVLARPPWDLADCGVLREAPSRLRTATAVLTREQRNWAAVASGALPPARMPRWGREMKVAQARALRVWVDQQALLPVILGLDANGPLVDTVDGVRFHDDEEALLFGFDGAPLEDTYRASMTEDDRARVRRLRPEGPLVVTHLAGGRPRRYDHILTRGSAVIDAGYVIDDAFAAGSDHALAYARLRLQA